MKTERVICLLAALLVLVPGAAHAAPVAAFVAPLVTAISGAFAGFAATGVGTFLTTTFVGKTLVSIGLSYAANLLTRAMGPDVSMPKPSENMVNYAAPVAYWERVYGRTRKGGPIGFTGFTGSKRHYVILIASHSTKGPFQHYLDERSVEVSDVTGNVLNTAIGTYGYGNIRSYTGQPGQTSDIVLQNNFQGQWTEAHDLAGFSYAAIWAKRPKPQRFSNIYPNGREWTYAPVWEGCDTIYDPRDQTRKYTANAALVIADWIVNVLGERVDWDAVAVEANVCDEVGLNRAGNPVSRWRINGTLNESMDIETQRSTLSMAADAFFFEAIDGVIGFHVGRWIEPSVTLTDADFLSLTVSAGGWGDQSPSEIVVQYVEPSTGWREAPSAPWSIDGRGELNREVKACHLVTNHCQAMRLAKRFSRIERAEYRIQATVRLVGYELLGQRFVRIQSDALGGEFYAEIDSMRRGEDGITFDIEARSVSPEDFAFNGLTDEPARPDYNTPTSSDVVDTVDTILVRRLDGYAGATHQVEWLEQDESLAQQVQFREIGTSTWTVLTVPEEQGHLVLTALRDGTEYQVQVRNRTGSGREGDWFPVPPATFVAEFVAKPYPSWIVGEEGQWESPSGPQPDPACAWDEALLEWDCP